MRMSVGQWRRLDVVERVERGTLTITEGAQVLGLSRRQMQRVRSKVKVVGAAGVIHGNTGRAPKHKTSALIAERVVELWRGKYTGFNDQHFTEKLEAKEGLALSRSTVRRMLRAAGIGPARLRRPPKHRRRRDRRPQAGQMILWDGSRHDWLEHRGPRLCLMAGIDDATSELLPGGHFVEQECTLGYLRVLREIIKHKGVPLSAYMDRHAALKRNDKNWTREEQLAGHQEPTQVKRALDDLGIQVIYALSPQAKGRVERLWGTLQDRLVSELRLAKATTIEQANNVLAAYTREHNRRFALEPRHAAPAWRSCPPGLKPEEICALQYARVVLNNNTVRVGKETIDIRRNPLRSTYAKASVIVRHLLDGGYRVYFGAHLIARTTGAPPTSPEHEPRTPEKREARRQREKLRAKLKMQETTDSPTN
jgi:transposase